jgi:hypothetical protein
MYRRPLSLAAAATSIVLGGALLITSAQALTPPAGTPDLAQMTLQPADLQPGATVGRDRYAKPPKRFRAAYDRNFSAAATHGGVPLDAIETEILLAARPADAKSFYKVERRIYGSKLGRKLVASSIVGAAGKGSNITAKDVHFGMLRSIAVGQQSLLEPVSIRVNPVTLTADFVVVRVGDVVVNFAVLVFRPTLARSVPTGLAATIAAHISAVLAASGATGPTGATGTSGATGSTG